MDHIFSHQSPEFPELLSLQSVSEHTDSDATWEQIKQWSQQCIKGRREDKPWKNFEPRDPLRNSESWTYDHHYFCEKRSHSALSFQPTRLVKVGHCNEDIRLDIKPGINDSTISEDGRKRYLTLSHCWGEDLIPLVTTSANLEQHIQQIPWDSLTKTFQHAICATRRLGY